MLFFELRDICALRIYELLLIAQKFANVLQKLFVFRVFKIELCVTANAKFFR